MSINADALEEVMGRHVSHARYATLLPAYRAALLEAQCTTVNRAAMFAAQLGHESLGLRYLAEIWGPTAAQRTYEGRRELGNTQPGDGSRYRGRSAIQITGRHNYSELSRWAHSRDLVPTATYFVDHPLELESDRFGFLGAVWYWTVARSQINQFCDAGDVEAVTRAINGGTHGLADRRARWERARRMGERILPGPPGEPAPVLPNLSKRPTIRLGARGGDVRDLQSRLNRDYHAYSRLTVDGMFGPLTATVVREFQRRAGLAVDGIVDPATWKALHL